MSHHSTRTSAVLEAIRAVLASLAELPPSPGMRPLLEKALSFASAVEEWPRTAPSTEAREATMRQILALHIAVANLRQGTPEAQRARARLPS